MALLLSKIHLFIFIWICWNAYDTITTHSNMIEEIESKLPLIQKQIKEKEKELKNIDIYKKDIEKAKEQIEQVALQIEELQQRLPNKISDTANLESITSVAENINLKEIRLRPGKESDKGFYITKEYGLTAQGTYLQFLIFLEKMGELSETANLFNIKYLKFKTIKGKRKGRFQLIGGKIGILAYKYNESYREDRGIKKIETDLQKKSKAKRNNRRKPKNRKKK